MRLTKTILLVAILLTAACSTTDVLPPEVTPEGEDRYLLHPLYDRTVAPAVANKFEAAYRYALAGEEGAMRQRLADIALRNPELLAQTHLVEALYDIRAGRFDEAQAALKRVRETEPDNPIAVVYEAEIAIRQKQPRVAYDLYRKLSGIPTAAERIAQLEGVIFNELYAAAQTAPDAESIRLLREALAFNAGAVEPRVLLAQKLVGQRNFEEARRELEPLLNTAADRADVQEILAEIDVGRGRYQEAIVRYDRLARRTKEPRHQQRLDEIKSDWSAANMPSHYRAALETPELTRADLAVLLYWTVPSIRFAQNLASPQIAVDVEGLAGREEMIRAIAIGMFDVDPVTRRVGPHRPVTAGRLSTHLARVLSMRGAACARGVPTDKVLGACGVEDPLSKLPPEATVTGRDALRSLEQVAKKL